MAEPSPVSIRSVRSARGSNAFSTSTRPSLPATASRVSVGPVKLALNAPWTPSGKPTRNATVSSTPANGPSPAVRPATVSGSAPRRNRAVLSG